MLYLHGDTPLGWVPEWLPDTPTFVSGTLEKCRSHVGISVELVVLDGLNG